MGMGRAYGIGKCIDSKIVNSLQVNI